MAAHQLLDERAAGREEAAAPDESALMQMLSLMSIRLQMRCHGPERPYQRSRGLASMNILASWWPPS
eukprot:9399366-Pyramimonas_sp.AAC.1